jgi:hypothetical protein
MLFFFQYYVKHIELILFEVIALQIKIFFCCWLFSISIMEVSYPSVCIGVEAPNSSNSVVTKRRTHFTEQEDDILCSAVLSYINCFGAENIKWENVVVYIPGKTAKQCRDRWRHRFSAECSPWTEQEDKILLDAIVKWDKSEIWKPWNSLVPLLQGRSSISIKNHVNGNNFKKKLCIAKDYNDRVNQVETFSAPHGNYWDFFQTLLSSM